MCSAFGHYFRTVLLLQVRKLRKEDEALCSRLEMDPYYVSSKVIPTKAQLDALRKHVVEMKDLKAKRSAQFTESRLAIMSCLEQLEEEPNSSFERMVVCDDEESFTLSYANVDKVQTFLNVSKWRHLIFMNFTSIFCDIF